MARFVIDASAALHLANRGVTVSEAHELLAPTLWRSQVLSALHEAVHAGELAASTARDHLAYLSRLKVRLLGDAVLRKVAWEVADELGWASTYDAEYIALTKLQADALITLEPDLARSAETLLAIAQIEALHEACATRKP
jgi:predicted nucleic acid-binding protein